MNNDNKRVARIHVRVTPREHDIIENLANQRNISMSQFVRRSALNPDAKRIDIDTSELLEIRRLLKITSNNMNQLAWQSHRRHNTGELEREIRSALTGLGRTAYHIDEFLEKTSRSL